MAFAPAVLDCNVLTLDIAGLLQPLAESCQFPLDLWPVASRSAKSLASSAGPAAIGLGQLSRLAHAAVAAAAILTPLPGPSSEEIGASGAADYLAALEFG
jgi:hypothetical protein